MDLSKPQKFDRKDCLNWKFIAMIILHFHLHQQFKWDVPFFIRTPPMEGIFGKF